MNNEPNNTSSIISKVWSFCTILKDDGVSYDDYLEQLTYLLFLKMANDIIENLKAGIESFEEIPGTINGKQW